jgi:hypothetical protein
MLSNTPMDVVNSTEIRFTNIQLDPVAPISPVVRRNPHRSGVLRPEESAPTLDKFELPVDVEQLILDSCW